MAIDQAGVPCRNTFGLIIIITAIKTNRRTLYYYYYSTAQNNLKCQVPSGQEMAFKFFEKQVVYITVTIDPKYSSR